MVFNSNKSTMNLSLQKYQVVYKSLGERLDCLSEIQIKFHEIAPETIESIYRLKWQEELKRITRKLSHDSTMKKIYEQYLYKRNSLENSPYILVQLAKSHGFPPCFLARIILRLYYLSSIVLDSEFSNTITSNVFKAYNRDDNDLRLFIRKALEDPIQTLSKFDPILGENVQNCVLCDDICSPQAEIFKQKVGLEKEQELFCKLKDLNIDFIVENGMRHLGFPKTPDVLLTIPVALNGFVINWIESKAFFGDPNQHDRYLKKQYWAYHNRFGPGLVIYWFGFVKELYDQLIQHGILISSDLKDFDSCLTRIEPLESINICTVVKYKNEDASMHKPPPGFDSILW